MFFFIQGNTVYLHNDTKTLHCQVITIRNQITIRDHQASRILDNTQKRVANFDQRSQKWYARYAFRNSGFMHFMQETNFEYLYVFVIHSKIIQDNNLQ
jgi:hypothetical protein